MAVEEEPHLAGFKSMSLSRLFIVVVVLAPTIALAAPANDSGAVTPEALNALVDLVKAAATPASNLDAAESITSEKLLAIASLISAIAWPLIAVYILGCHGRAIGAFIADLESVTGPGGWGFKRRMKEVLASADAPGRFVDKRIPPEKDFAAAQRVATAATPADLMEIRRQIRMLAAEYEKVRADMPPGSERTRRMEVIVSKMRTLGEAAFPLRFQLKDSGSPGERLAVIAMLQLRPDPDLYDWLAERAINEKPFVAYHALLALLYAARDRRQTDRQRLKIAVERCKQALAKLPERTDRKKTLNEIETELQKVPAAESEDELEEG